MSSEASLVALAKHYALELATLAGTAWAGLVGFLARDYRRRLIELEQEVADLKEDVPSRSEMNGHFNELRQEIREGFKSMHNRMDHRVDHGRQHPRREEGSDGS